MTVPTEARRLPPAGIAALAVLWAVICTANAAWALWLLGRLESGETAPLLAAFFFGALGGLAVAWLAGALFRNARDSVRLAAFLVTAFAATVVATGLLVAIPQYLYYTQWHAEAFSKVWIIQFVFTFAGAFYQFAVVGLRFYFPFAFLALLAIGWVLVHRRH